MDPDTCYAALCMALSCEALPAAADHLGHLEGWIGRGGYAPAQLADDAESRGETPLELLAEIRRQLFTVVILDAVCDWVRKLEGKPR